MTPEDESLRSEARIRVLVVDDHPFFREGIAAWIGRQSSLELCGWADTPQTALAAIKETRPHLVLLDLQLKDGDGFEVLRAIKEDKLSSRVIVISQKDEIVFAERALRAGAHGYVLKEEASDEMRAAIQTVISGGVHVSLPMRRQLLATLTGSQAPVPDKLRGLFNRELEVLQLLGRGRTTKEIAQEMGISPKTVESYRESLKRKLGLADSLALVRFATLWQQTGRAPEKA